MLERKKLLAGFFITLLSLNLCGVTEAATNVEKEEARMWGGFRDKVSCTVSGSVANEEAATEKVVVKEVVVPVYRYPFLFIWDDWYHWGRWHHHHHVHRPPAPRTPKHHIGVPAPRPPRPAIGKPIPRPGRPDRIGMPNPNTRPPRREQVGRPNGKPRQQAVGKPAPRPARTDRIGKSNPRPQRDEQMIFQDRGPRGGGARHHGGGRPGGARPPRRG